MLRTAVLACCLTLPTAALANPAEAEGPEAVYGWAYAAAAGDADSRLGIEITSMTRDLRAFFGAPDDQGVLVQRVVEGSRAEDAGLRVGDVVLRVGETPIDTYNDLVGAIFAQRGESVDIQVLRKGKDRTLSAELPPNAAMAFGSERFQTIPLTPESWTPETWTPESGHAPFAWIPENGELDMSMFEELGKDLGKMLEDFVVQIDPEAIEELRKELQSELGELDIDIDIDEDDIEEFQRKLDEGSEVWGKELEELLRGFDDDLREALEELRESVEEQREEIEKLKNRAEQEDI